MTTTVGIAKKVIAPAMNLSKGEAKLVKYVGFGLAGLLLAAGTYAGVKWYVARQRSRSVEQWTFEEGSPAAYAKELELAFLNDGFWGTDVKLVRKVLVAIPTKEVWRRVQQAYKLLTRGQVLNKRLAGELTASEYQEMKAIIAGKPENENTPVLFNAETMAQRLEAAFNYHWGPFPMTDEAAIKQVFIELPSKAAWQTVKAAYLRLYQVSLDRMLQSELDLIELFLLKRILDAKPPV